VESATAAVLTLIIRALDNPDNGYRRAAHFLTAQRSIACGGSGFLDSGIS
jgi:hypothetical protein